MQSSGLSTLKAYALAGAAAHDFNEQLTIILCAVEEARAMLPQDHSARTYLTEAMAAAMRLGHRSGVLMSFAARKGVQPAVRRMEDLV